MSEETNLGGRPPHEPTEANRKQVRTLSGYGVPEHDIARTIGISKPTLVKYYRDELDDGMMQANAKVAESLFRKATGDGTAAVTAAIFWMKTRARWKETSAHEIAGPGGGPVQFEQIKRLIVDPTDPDDQDA